MGSLSPRVNLIGEYIENQLSMRQSGLEEWFKEVELPRIAGYFLPLLKKWSMEYTGRFAHRILYLCIIILPLDGLLTYQLSIFANAE